MEIFKNVEPDENEFRLRQNAYRDIFKSSQGEIVLRDLLQYCRFTDESISDIDAFNTQALTLKHVILHIQRMIESEEIE